jgi:3-phosphoshikimate 1-carboxyvinyltransferase
MEKRIEPGQRKGSVAIPASKSDGQRAYLSAALANGRSVISGSGSSNDELAMLAAIQALGAVITYANNELIINGIEKFPSSATVSAGESGLGIRLLGMVCAVHNGNFVITGTGSLVSRPMDFFEEVIPVLGGECLTNLGKLPLEIVKPVNGGEARVDGSLSSQFISGLLMALPLAERNSVLHVKELKSSPYVGMTLQTLQRFGIEIQHENLKTFRIKGGQRYRPAHYRIDADWSSASYWLVAAAIGHDISLTGLNFSSPQADKALLDFLMMANCRIIRSEHELTVDGFQRRAFTVDATDCPDLFPALVTLAAFCEGRSVIKGAHRLVHKESNRARALQSEFRKLGLQIELSEDEMTIHGKGVLEGGITDAHHDHRIAMCLAVAGLSARNAVIIHGAEAVGKSYPSFWETLEALA